VEIPPDFLAGLADAYPFYTSAEIPSGTYPGVTKAVDSVAVEALLAARADLSEDLVYTVTRALFEHTDVLAAAHARGKDISLGSALEGMSILLHPGARQYYQEKGLILP
jgi:TRAP transporter TAXI family solute receptor